jgi:ribosomal protein S18 acetylase RimI-like enzyme
VQLRRLGPGDVDAVLAATHLFDGPPTQAWTEDFLSRPGHHLVLAEVDRTPAGFITGVEIAHPDKGVEMLLYELGVDEPYRRRGIGRALVEALKAIAMNAGCTGMWVPVEQGDGVATALYLATGAQEPVPGTTLWWSLT